METERDSQGNVLVTDPKSYGIKDEQLKQSNTPQHGDIFDSKGNKLVTDLSAYGLAENQEQEPKGRKKGRIGKHRKAQPIQQQQGQGEPQQTEQDLEPNKVPNLSTKEVKKEGNLHYNKYYFIIILLLFHYFIIFIYIYLVQENKSIQRRCHPMCSLPK